MEAAAHYRTASVRLASGGHPPALVLRADGTAGFLPTPGGLLVGILPTASFATATTVLGAGNTRLLYTDGLTEARTGGRTVALCTETRPCVPWRPHTPASRPRP